MGLTVYTADGRIKDRGGVYPAQGVVVRANKNAAQAYVATARVALTNFDATKVFDSNNWFDVTTGRFTPKIAGYYQITARLITDLLTADSWTAACIFKNGVLEASGGNIVYQRGGAATPQMEMTETVYLNGTTDYVQVGGNAAVNTNFYGAFTAALIGSSVGVIPEPWTAVGVGSGPAFLNSWVDFGSDRPTTAFFKDPHGVVRMRGSVKSGTINADIFTLPVGYRPSGRLKFAIDANGAFGSVNVRSDGGVGQVAGGNTEIALNNISFRAEA